MFILIKLPDWSPGSYSWNYSPPQFLAFFKPSENDGGSSGINITLTALKRILSHKHHRNLQTEMNPLTPNMSCCLTGKAAKYRSTSEQFSPQCEMMTCNNNFQSVNEGWDEDEEPAAAQTEKLDSCLSDCLQSFQLLTLLLAWTVVKLC